MPVPAVATGANPYGPQISFRTESVLPPAAVYVGPDDALLLDARCPSITAPLHLTLRRLNPDGEISSDQYDLKVGTSGAAEQTFTIPPAEGYILSAHCRTDAAERGQLFVKLHARRNVGGTDQALGHLFFQGYISTDDHLGYPQSPTQSSLDGRGWLHAIPAQISGPGVPVIWTVPQGLRWLVRVVTAQLTTDSLVYTRNIVMQLNDASGTQFAVFPSNYGQPASTTATYTWGEGLQMATQQGFVSAPLVSDLLLSPNWQVALGSVPIIDADDQWASGTIMVEEYVGT